MTHVPYSLSVARASGSNFTASFFFLPEEQRRGILTLYALARLVDDAVDEAADPATALAQIKSWREFLAACYSPNGHSSSHPLFPELRETIQRFEIPTGYFEDLFRGVEMDLEKKRYESFEELKVYCYHVAGTIGLLCNQVFGRRDSAGRDFAVALGTAFQLTNILRDIGSDARRGRIYLPLEDLRGFYCTEHAILTGQRERGFDDLVHFEAKRAWGLFREAEGILSAKERRNLIAAKMMSSVYQKLLKKLERENFPVFEKKVSLSKLEKGLVLLKAFLP